MALRPRKPICSAAIIERHDNCILIVMPADTLGNDRLWRFPRGRVAGDESPEAAIRRICRTELGVSVEVVVGQPPLPVVLDGEEFELRYFFCGVSSGTAAPGDAYRRVRWIPPLHLAEYDFDDASRPVSSWLQQERPGRRERRSNGTDI